MESDPTADELHPLLEKWERYILTIEDSGVTHLRTVKLEYDDHDENKVRQYTYDATAQSADGITPGAEVVVRVYQLGGTVGEGNVTEDYTIPAYDVWMPPTGGIWGAEATEGTVLKVT